MKKYNLINNIGGWFAFAVAAIVYLMTIEPTTSFWDCGEFITTAFKLEVGHPPGAPFFMMTGKFFSLFASDPSQVAMMINAMSAIMSALTILFLFWTITHLAKKLIAPDGDQEMTMGEIIVIIGSGLVGALAYTFSDTFWFSAVEGEVYAYSSMFTALVFWLILKWENRADQPGSDKWLVLIAYVMGLSIGVHLLNLLCIPAIGLIYYFKKNKNATLQGTLIALGISLMLVVVLMYGIIPGFTKVGGWFELLFVNSFGFSYNTGAFVYLILVVLTIGWGLYETLSEKGSLTRAKVSLLILLMLTGVTFIGGSVVLWLILIAGVIGLLFVYKKINFKQLNTTLLCLMVILIGYSSFALIPIRSSANPPMDQNSPEDLFSLASYLNREQYGDRPLFYGKTFASTELRDANGRVVMASEKENYSKIVKKSDKQKDQYIVAGTTPTYDYTNKMLFPRMYSTVDRHLNGYRVWGNLDRMTDNQGEYIQPTFMQNLHFFVSYQMNYMYFRYFMWNFSGRQNDVQGNGTITNGNWITGIGFIDELLGRGPQDNLPPDITENKAHNTFFALPLLLGILGILFQVSQNRRGKEQFLVTFMLFFMTGIAIILYLNQQPQEPRERDYAYAGSFYAFCIWIGLGVAFIWHYLRKVLPNTPAAALATAIGLVIPIQMASQTWDDHDRSGRYTARDFGHNYLTSCEPGAIIFTMGDNDTFPLWYAQEVEGYRTDVRVCNLSYLQTEWYVDQMRRQSYESTPLPINWETDRYSGNKGMAVYIFSKKDLQRTIMAGIKDQGQGMEKWIDRINYADYFDTKVFKDTMPASEALDIMRTKDVYVPTNPFVKDRGVVIPASAFTMPIDVDKVDWAGIGTKPESQFVVDLGSNKSAIYRDDIMVFEMLKNISADNWKRPIYYAVTVGDGPLNTAAHAQLEGIVNRIVPGTIDSTGVNVDKMFDNLVNKYKWGGIENPKVYLDAPSMQMSYSFRQSFSQLVNALIEKGDGKRALIALDRCMEAIPGTTIPRRAESVTFVNSYFELGQNNKAQAVADEIMNRCEKSLAWYTSMDRQEMLYSTSEIREYMDCELRMLDVYQRYDNAKYQTLRAKLLDRSELFLSNGVRFSDRGHPLDYMMSLSLRGYMTDSNAVTKKAEQTIIERTASMMQKYKPELLQKYPFK